MLWIPGGPEDFVAVMEKESLVDVHFAGGWQLHLAQLLIQAGSRLFGPDFDNVRGRGDIEEVAEDLSHRGFWQGEVSAEIEGNSYRVLGIAHLVEVERPVLLQEAGREDWVLRFLG